VRKLINLDIKKEIISERESGKSVDLSVEYVMAKSTISTVVKERERERNRRKKKGRNKKCTGCEGNL
jgi:Mor family transcriptional regulator